MDYYKNIFEFLYYFLNYLLICLEVKKKKKPWHPMESFLGGGGGWMESPYCLSIYSCRSHAHLITVSQIPTQPNHNPSLFSKPDLQIHPTNTLFSILPLRMWFIQILISNTCYDQQYKYNSSLNFISWNSNFNISLLNYSWGHYTKKWLLILKFLVSYLLDGKWIVCEIIQTWRS